LVELLKFVRPITATAAPIAPVIASLLQDGS
jgi:hypothetical protein